MSSCASSSSSHFVDLVARSTFLEVLELGYGGEEEGRTTDCGDVVVVTVDVGIGEGVAIPHGKLPGLGNLVAAFGVSRQGVDFEAIDGKPTHLFFALVAPENSAGVHLKALARISRLFKNPRFRAAILEAPTVEAIHALIVQEDARP